MYYLGDCMIFHGTLTAVKLLALITAGFGHCFAVDRTVAVTIEQRVHTIITQQMRDDTPHAATSEVVKKQLKDLKKQMKLIESPIREQLRTQHQAVYDARQSAQKNGHWADRSFDL